MTAPLRAGVIGLGVGQRHAATYAALPGCTLEAICDLDPAKLAETGDAHGIAKRHTDWRRITDDPDIDLISICSYDDGHAEQAVRAFANGKHLMVEKPVALYRHEAEAMVRAMTDSGRRLSSNLILRMSPRFQALHRLVRDGTFGEIFYMEGDYVHEILWKLTRGWRGRMAFYCVAYGGGIHLIDLMRWLIGREVTEVAAMGNQILSAGSVFRYPDTIAALLRFEGGAMAKSLTTLGPQRRQIHQLDLYGTRATFRNDIPDGKLFRGSDPADEEPFTVPYPAIGKGDLLPDFVAAIREGREPLVSAADVFRVMDVCFAIWEAVEQRRSIPVTYLI